MSTALTHPRMVAWLFCALLALLLPAAAAAQGRIAGTVTGADGTPLGDAQATVTGTRYGAISRADGRFVITGVPAGTHSVRVQRMGHRSATVADVVVVDGQETAINAQLEVAPTTLAGTVVSASRRVEKITDAPATVSRIEESTIARAAGPGLTGVLKEVKGVDVIRTGVTTTAINARGFNSSFNNRMLLMEDGRIAVLPENGLPVGPFTTISKVDLAGVEVLVGPGAALYGPDASNGVLTLLTKDPRQYPGATVELSGGTRNYMDVQGRYAGMSGNIGYKVSGGYMAADEFENSLRYGNLQEIGIDWRTTSARGNGSLVYYSGANRIEFNGGMSQYNGVGQTNVGRNQLKDWTYNHQQVRFTSPRIYLNAYRAQSLSGDSYAINRFTQNRAAQPSSVSDDSVRLLSDWPADGRMYAAEAQHNFIAQPLLGTRVIWGGQFRYDMVSSKREWLTDRETGKDLTMQQAGVYMQTETPISDYLRVVLAGRYDKHEDYDAQFSPKVGIVLTPVEDNSIRVTYNRAFKSPTTLQNHFNIVNFVPTVAVMGNRAGFTVRNPNLGTSAFLPALVPEENTTWELGYKGVISERLFLDATFYRSRYNHFLTPLITLNVPALGTFASMGTSDQRIQDGNGVPQIVLTYLNLGRADIQGIDFGMRYRITPSIGISGSASYMLVDSIDIPTPTGFALSANNRRELSTLNAPTMKWTAGMDYADPAGSLSGGFTVRYMNEYFFASGINVGHVPTYSTLDMNLGYRMPFIGANLNVGVSNLFTCSSRYVTEGTHVSNRVTSRKRGCGFDRKHGEMINMPEIGTMVFVGVRYQR